MTDWLIDTSALVRLADAVDGQTWAERIERGLVRVGTVTRLQIGYGARSGAELRESVRQQPLASMSVEYLTPAIEDRAVEIQQLLTDRGHHRGPAVPDLLIAATAELAGLAVLQRDTDFQVIAEVTGQQLERLRLDAGDFRDGTSQANAGVVHCWLLGVGGALRLELRGLMDSWGRWGKGR